MRCLAGLILLASITHASAQDVASHYRQAIAAYRNGDPPGMLAEARAALDLRPRGVSLTYLHAAALAWNGRSDEALAALNRLADRGLSYHPEHEPFFETLADDPRFVALIDRFAANGRPTGKAKPFRSLDDGHFIPEGIAYDPVADRLYLGSIRQQRIVTIDADGSVSDFVAAGAHGLLSALGMRLAEDRLVVATSGMKEGLAPEDGIGRAGILVFDASGEPLAAHFRPGKGHVLGDVVVAADVAYTTDSLTGEVLALDLDTGQWRELIPAGRLVSPQGLALDPGGSALYVADYRGGLTRIDLTNGTSIAVAEPDEVTLEGIDGLYRHGDDLIAIQNGVRPHRIVRVRLDDAGAAVTGVEVLAANLDGFDEPTLGTVVADDLYFVANSHWPRFDAEGNLPPREELTGPLVMKLALKSGP